MSTVSYEPTNPFCFDASTVFQHIKENQTAADATRLRQSSSRLNAQEFTGLCTEQDIHDLRFKVPMRLIRGFAACPCLLKHVMFVGPFEATTGYLTVHPTGYRSLHLSSEFNSQRPQCIHSSVQGKGT